MPMTLSCRSGLEPMRKPTPAVMTNMRGIREKKA